MKWPWTWWEERISQAYKIALDAELKVIKEAMLDIAHEVEGIPDAVDLAPDLALMKEELAVMRSLAHMQDARIKELTLAIGEGIERVSRAENRVKATITRARKELASHGLLDPGIEAEVEELRLVDGDRGEDGEVLPLSSSVEATSEADDEASLKRMTAVNLRLRGLA